MSSRRRHLRRLPFQSSVHTRTAVGLKTHTISVKRHLRKAKTYPRHSLGLAEGTNSFCSCWTLCERAKSELLPRDDAFQVQRESGLIP